MTLSEDPAGLAARIESAIGELGTLADPQVKAQAQEVVRLLMALYGAGLSRMLDIVRAEEGGTAAVLERFAGDGLIASLLVLHDLHPHPLQTRVERALAALQPHLPQSTEITLVAASGDRVEVRFNQGAAARGASDDMIRMALERAIQEAAPEVGAIQIDGPDDRGERPLIQIVRRADLQGAPRPAAS
jgi:hypothetical protein